MSTVIAARLSQAQREYLVDHIDGARPITAESVDAATRRALLHQELIYVIPCGSQRPVKTALTDLGRATLGAFLGMEADRLRRAGVLGERYSELVRRLLIEEERGGRPRTAYGKFVERPDHAADGGDPAQLKDRSV